MTNGFGVTIEMLVAVLLALTIAYCISLNRRLKLLKADEQSLRATISELVTATEIAERAIGGLRLTVEDCERGLGAQLRTAERACTDLERSIASGKELFERLARIVIAGGGPEPEPTRPASLPAPMAPWRLSDSPSPRGAQAVAAAAQAFAERLRVKVNGLAA